MTGHMDAHLLTTAIFSPGSLDENDNSLSGTRLREGSKKERFNLLNDILYFLKETMELDEALKFCPDLEEIGFENAEGVIRRLLRLAVAMRQDDEKAKKDKNPDMDAFVKKTLKKIYKDHTSSNKKEEPAEEKETEAELDDPRKDIPGSIHHDLTGEHSDNQEELDEFLGEQPDAEGEHEEGYHSSEKAEELEESFSKYLDKSNKDQWLVEAINKMFDEDTETPKRLAKVRLLREAAQRKNALKEESYVDELYADRSEYEQDLKQSLNDDLDFEGKDITKLGEAFKSQNESKRYPYLFRDKNGDPVGIGDSFTYLARENPPLEYTVTIERIKNRVYLIFNDGHKVPFTDFFYAPTDRPLSAIERMEQEEKDFDDWTEHDPEEIKWNREHNSFDEAANLKETTPPYLFKDKDGNPVSIGDSFTYLARVNPPLEYTATIEKIKNRIYIVFDDGRKMLFKDFFYAPTDRPLSKKIQKINKEEIDPEDAEWLKDHESFDEAANLKETTPPYLFKDKDGNPVSIGDSFTYLARVNPPLEYTATIEKIKNRTYIVFDDGRKMLFKDFFYAPTDRPLSKKIQKIDSKEWVEEAEQEKEIDPEDKKWLDFNESKRYPYLFRDKDGEPVKVGDSFKYLARVNPPLEYTIKAERIGKRVYLIFDDGRKMLFKDFFYGPVDRLFSKKIQKIDSKEWVEEAEQEKEIDPEDKKWLHYHNSFDEGFLGHLRKTLRDKAKEAEDSAEAMKDMCRNAGIDADTASVKDLCRKVGLDVDGVNNNERHSDSLDEAASKAAYPGAHDLAKFLCEKLGKKYAWIDPATTGYRVKLWDLEKDEDGEAAVKKLQKKLDSLGYPEIKAKLAGVGKRTTAFIVPYSSKIKGKKVKESYLDGTMSGPSDMKSSTPQTENPNMPQDDNDVVLQAAAEVLKDKPQNELQDFLASLEK